MSVAAEWGALARPSRLRAGVIPSSPCPREKGALENESGRGKHGAMAGLGAATAGGSGEHADHDRTGAGESPDLRGWLGHGRRVCRLVVDVSAAASSSDAQAGFAGDGDVGTMSFEEETGRGTLTHGCGCARTSGEITRQIMRLQLITLIWMLVECAIALYSAWRARSPVLLAFGADSLIELLSALVVLLQFVPRLTLSTARATRLAGILLFVLAAIITISSALALWRHVRPETSWIGMGIAVAALVVMPLLSLAKRRIAKTARNPALTADAVQSATCAYLAGITLAGLAFNAVLHVRWIDPVAALAAVPVICVEGKKALRGETCCQLSGAE